MTLNTPSLNQITNLLETLKKYDDKLKEFDFEADEAFDVLKSKSYKQIKFANALLIQKQYMQLKKVLYDWGMPKSEANK